MPGVPTSTGCNTCRKQKKKCDEKQPSCSRCLRLQVPCIGSGTRRFKFHEFSGEGATTQQLPLISDSNFKVVTVYQSKTVITGKTRPKKSLNHRSEKKSAEFLGDSSGSETASLKIPQYSFSSTPEFSSPLEQRLMHRWLTRTMWCVYGVPNDMEYLQEYLPHMALANKYLKNGLLALAAADFAHSGGQKQYLMPALEYSVKAAADFRLQLIDLNEHSASLLYAFIECMAIFSFVTSGLPRPLARLSKTFDVMLSAKTMFLARFPNSLPSCQSEIVSSIDMSVLDILDDETASALDLLTTISRQIRVLITADGHTEIAGDTEVYQIAIGHIKCSFAEHKRGVIKNYCWILVSVVDRCFFQSLKQLEPMALLIMMYFGVILDRMGRDPTAWYIGSRGKDLVEDISEILELSPVSQIPDGQVAITWSRQQVGILPYILPPSIEDLEGC
ncbi:hypothetical protein BGW36DRAFT_389250 [Talaromyces proteolyticus]|uniref:Zn(2)-C6 fungal-type domain-containing protein n=1 Tax=Talaromyces proteolyticus TaxID=1131652 RepID=A0AAD4PTG0_9EURO|nr:uncharacterized protein BGW36DRAFT_389250 [Talaromyces proteolyticus]KAH8690741.1 hypothetical protein BGW36DRAFT_389250 [Talaromyces proteolyticus]